MPLDLSNITLRFEEQSPYFTKGATLSFTELDNNLLGFGDAIEEMQVNIEALDREDAYVNGTVYNAGEYVTFNGRLYVYIGLPDSGNLPTNPAFWTWKTSNSLIGQPHQDRHLFGKVDAIDGDKIGVTFIPSNYTRSTTPVQVTNVEELTAHLYGIDQMLAGGSALSSANVSGVLTGGEVTPNGGDSTKYDVAAGTGIIINWVVPGTPTKNVIAWTAKIGVSPPDPTKGFTDNAIDAAGNLVHGGVALNESGISLTDEQERILIPLQAVQTLDGVNVDGVSPSSRPAYEVTECIVDWIQAHAPLTTGNIYSDATTTTMSKAAGATGGLFINRAINPQAPTIKSNPQIPTVTTGAVYQDGASGFTFEIPSSTIVLDLWDDGSGTLQTMNNNKWAVRRIYFFGETDLTVTTYGQAEYNSKAEAKAAIFNEDPVLPQSLTFNGAFTTALVHIEGADLTDILQAEFVVISAESIGGGATAIIPPDSITNVELAQMPANTVKVNNTALSDDPVDMTMGVSTILARLSTGNIVAASISQIQTELGYYADGGESAGADRTIGNIDNFDLAIITDNSERINILNDGSIGFGTSPLYDFHLFRNSSATSVQFNIENAGTGDAGFRIEAGGVWYHQYIDNDAANKLKFESDNGLHFVVDGTTENMEFYTTVDFNEEVYVYSTLYGSKDPGGFLELSSTDHGTKGLIEFGQFAVSAYDENLKRLGIGTLTPGAQIEVNGDTAAGTIQISTNVNTFNSTIGNLEFIADNNAAERISYARIFSTIKSNTDGDEDGALSIRTIHNGVEVKRIEIQEDGTIQFNDTNVTNPQILIKATTGATDILLDPNAESIFESDLRINGVLTIPFDTAQTLSSNGEFAIDTVVLNWAHGLPMIYATEELGIVTMARSEFTTPLDDQSPVYNSLTEQFEMKVRHTLQNSLGYEEPTDSDDITLFRTDVAITITEVIAVLVGTASPSVTYQLKHSTDRSAAGNALTTSAAVTSITVGATATLSDATIPADSWVWIETTAQSGTVEMITINWRFTED